MELSPLSVMLLLISLIPVAQAEGSPKAVVSINPNTHVFIGETVTLRCDIQGGGDTQWTYRWEKKNNGFTGERQKLYKDNTMQEFIIWSVKDSDSGTYTCRGHGRDSQSSEISDAVTLTVSERPQAVVSVSPQSWLTEGDSVTLSCEVTDSSTDWTFSWYTVVPYRDGLTGINNNGGYSVYVELLSDSSRGSGGKYTLSPAALNHTGVYMCRGERGEPALHSQYSNPQPLWITGESPPVSLIINPSRTQHFTDDSLSLSCEDQSNSTGWTVRRYTHSERVLDCSHWGSVTGSTCNISFLSTSYTGVYWCESESGENSNPVHITVHDGDVILESPVHPVTEGHPLTLRCLYRNPNPSNLRADFYKDGSVLQNQTTGEMIIQTVSKSDEGFYHCKHPERGESPKSWISVRLMTSLIPVAQAQGESPPVSLIINPSRTQHFTNDSLSLSCEDQSNSTGWTVRRYTHSERVLDCSHWGSVTGSTCNISFLSTSYTGVYWCESESGENSNPVNITVHDGDVILESPVHPVTEGHPLTLRCLCHNPNPSNLRADFYKDGSVLQNQTTGEMIIQTVSKSDEGFYHCKHPERGESPKSWISVRRLKPYSISGPRSSGGTLGLVVGLGFLFIAFLILMILLWSHKRKKEKQPKTKQTSDRNQNRSAAEGSQSGHTPLQAGSANIYATVHEADTSGTGEAAAEISEATYAQVTKKKKTNRNNGADADVTYAEIELKPAKKAKRVKGKASVDDDTVYSELKHNREFTGKFFRAPLRPLLS
ncbi:Fc receptor-like protein 5 [Hemibagrus wyckioides]|uniref:Fc receptor-like protein 5 n=1 Tax=Hemibagrus wyckioides TaxID=337641 RepID=UPI00266B8F2C|nr:Fc receptor-like protein 5 [Hemibagrus wyckioides]